MKTYRISPDESSADRMLKGLGEWTADEYAAVRRDALENHPLGPSTHMMEAGIKYCRGDRAASLSHLAITLALQPDNFGAHGLLARILQGEGQTDIAAAIAERGESLKRRALKRR